MFLAPWNPWTRFSWRSERGTTWRCDGIAMQSLGRREGRPARCCRLGAGHPGQCCAWGPTSTWRLIPPHPAQRSLDGSIDYCKRKVMFVKDKTEQISKVCWWCPPAGQLAQSRVPGDGWLGGRLAWRQGAGMVPPHVLPSSQRSLFAVPPPRQPLLSSTSRAPPPRAPPCSWSSRARRR